MERGDAAAALRAKRVRRIVDGMLAAPRKWFRRGVPVDDAATDAPGGEKGYRAFISYRHLDNANQGRQWAEWLHRWIESYRVPRELVGRRTVRGVVPRRVAPVFRDEWEMAGGGELGMLIGEGIEHSDALLVLCSPRSARSRGVRGEVARFKLLGKTDRIIPVVIEGEVGAADPALECAPRSLRFGVPVAGAEGRTRIDWRQPCELLGADFRPKGSVEQGYTSAAAYREALERRDADPATRRGLTRGQLRHLEDSYARRLRLERLRIMAGLLGVELNELVRRGAEERARRLKGLLWVAAAVVAVFGILTAWALHSLREASRGEHLIAQRLLDDENWPEAVAHLDRALSLWPENPDSAPLLWSVLRRGLLAHAMAPRWSAAMPGDLAALGWSADGRWLAIADRTGRVALRAAADGALAAEVHHGPEPVRALGFREAPPALVLDLGPAGHRALSVPALQPLGSATGALPLLPGRPISPDGRLVAAGQREASEPTPAIFDTVTGQRAVRLDAEPARCDFVAWSGDSGRIAIGTQGSGIVVFDARTGGALATVPKTAGRARRLEMDETGRHVLLLMERERAPGTGFAPEDEELWRLQPQPEQIWTQPIVAGAHLGRGDPVALAFWGYARGIDVLHPHPNGSSSVKPIEPGIEFPSALSFSADGSAAVAYGPDEEIALFDARFWDLFGRARLPAFDFAPHGPDPKAKRRTAAWQGFLRQRKDFPPPSLSPTAQHWALPSGAREVTIFILARTLEIPEPGALAAPAPGWLTRDRRAWEGWLDEERRLSVSQPYLSVRRPGSYFLAGHVAMHAGAIGDEIRWSASEAAFRFRPRVQEAAYLPWAPPRRADARMRRFALALAGFESDPAHFGERMPAGKRTAIWTEAATWKIPDPIWRETLKWWLAGRPVSKGGGRPNAVEAGETLRQ